jgi:hypothetical protein
MQLKPQTLSIIKSFSLINNSLLFPVGDSIATLSTSKAVYGRAKLTQSFDKRFAIGDISRFLSALSLFKEPELSFEKTQVKIFSGKQRINYTYTDEDAIFKPPEKRFVMPAKDIVLTLTQANLKAVLSATSALSAPEIAVVGEQGKLYVQALDVRDPRGDSFSVEVGETDKIFFAVFRAEYLYKIIPQEYSIGISTKGVSHFQTNDLEYYITLEEKHSKFG